MPHYRLYFLNPHSGHIDWAEEIEASDDVEAVAIVRDVPRKAGVELWQEGRRVLRLEKPLDVSQASSPLASRELPAG